MMHCRRVAGSPHPQGRTYADPEEAKALSKIRGGESDGEATSGRDNTGSEGEAESDGGREGDAMDVD